MSMVFCQGCGKEIHESAPVCPHCGASQRGVTSNSPQAPVSADPVLNRLISDNDSMGKFILLTLVTLGVYPFIWWSNSLEKLNLVSIKRTGKVIDLVILAALWSWQSVFLSAQPDTSKVKIVLSLIGMALGIAMLVYSYVSVVSPFVEGLDEKLLKDFKIDLRPNQFWVFIFSYFYIVFILNKLPDLLKRSQVLNGDNGSK